MCRQKLRQVEAALIEYRESLEERGIKKEEIEKKVAEHQKQLQYKYGLTDVNKDASHKSAFSSFPQVFTFGILSWMSFFESY